ncbi:MAG: glycoside hydrolase family 13 protein [Bacteroidales bacterium]|nr:glycoside hydrolase family 13 protein [Bacteroidales bacterium]
MNTSIKILIFFIAFSIRANAQPDHVEPPFWWAGMNHPELQIMVHGEQLSGMEIKINCPGVKVLSVLQAGNPDYLFIDLDISNAEPGSFDIGFYKDGVKKTSYNYQLKKREKGSSERDGFDNSDVLYLIMPDRFANGNPDNDEVDGMREGLNRREPYGRHGGDIQGITNNLDYISNMGFTAVWLNPIIENDMKQWSYHGYAATDFYRVDRRFGTNEEYRNLGRKAKEMGVRLIMDMIFNHCGSEHWWMNNLPSDDWINNYPGYVQTSHRRTVNHDLYASESGKKDMTEGWFVPSMPDLNQRNIYMANYLIQNSIWWIEYVGLAGIRMDTYPYPNKEMMAEWNRRVLLEYPDFNIVGEEWSLNPVVVSYWQRRQTNRDGYDGEMPGVMDFPLQSAVSRGLSEKEERDSGLITINEALANDIIYPDPYNMVIFPDNHDMPRFFMQMGMDKDLYRLGITFFLTTRGIPQIFYGSEILMTHTEGDDHGYIRKDFPGGWTGDKISGFTGKGLDKDARDMQDYFRKLLNWRKENPVIHTGRLTHFVPRESIYVYFRHNSEKTVMVILNKNDNTCSLKMDRFSEMIGDHLTGTDIITGESYNLENSLMIRAKAPLVLELN